MLSGALWGPSAWGRALLGGMEAGHRGAAIGKDESLGMPDVAEEGRCGGQRGFGVSKTHMVSQKRQCLACRGTSW